ncbi:hypothetical protein JG687_00004406 [Phytophthora cactorum]|uniref:Calmodulin n=2 Tax=Phytophthora cactorum TaxID=29920 RepID=A0A8T1UTB7_9STRA|nr:hypothetical protein JG687_00004406 [Phytophthora cactorum]
MGLFGKKGNGSRVAEGGGGALATAPPSTAASPSKGKTGDLELFGADSDESDDDATINRYAKDVGDEELDEKETAEAEKRKVAVLNSKLSPEELFKKYDTDGSGNISASEFLAMLPDLGISISAAKAMRIFRKCDTDGGGEIDLTEFKMAMFAVDPVSGNPLGFSPSTLLGPRDAFELFDEDGTGQIDELEFADVLEYFGMDVSDEKQEKIFKQYDTDKSGYIDYQEFRSMWIKLVDVREELTKRGVEVPKHIRLVKLQQMLEAILEEEEAREAAALEEATRFLQRQRDKELQEQLGRKAMIRAEDELAAALDAAGQVYIMGSGKYDQFIGDPVTRDENLFPGFKTMEDKPWWDVDLGQPAVIEKIRLWNRTDEPLNPSRSRSEYSSRLFPCWIFVSEFAFKDLEGNEGLRAAKVQSSAFELFRTNKRMTEWVLPTANTVGQFVRVQLQNKNFLHFAEVEVYGVYSAFKYVGKVGTVQCSTDATLVIMPPNSTQSVLDDYYLRAIQADADHATILRQYDAYERPFRNFGRGTPEILDTPCRLCRVFRDCEICEFYALAKYNRRSLGGSGQKPLPVRLVGDRMGLKELVQVAMAEGTLEAEQQDNLRQEQEAAEIAREAEAERQRVEEQAHSKRSSRLLKPFQGLNFRNKKSLPCVMLLNALRSKARTNGSSQASSSGASGGAKKQRSIHDFFSQSSAGNKRLGGKLRKARRSLEASAKGNSFSAAAMEDGEDDPVPIQKRIDYDVMDDESSEEPMLLASQSSDSGARRPRPKKIDFTGCSSQRSEPDFEPTHTPVRFGLPPTSQGYYTPGMATPMQQYSQDDMDFLTPRDQPVIPLSNPTTPSPLKKRPRLSSGEDMIQEEQVQNLTQDMTHMDVRHARKGLPSFSSQSSMDTGSPKVNVVVNAKRARPNSEQAASFLSEESYVNPFAPEPTTESGKKKISRRKRRSFPSAWVGTKNGSPVSKYLSDFSELGLIGSGSFSKVYKCIKKIDGWVYAVKKSKRHFRGKADTERALREVQALAALSSSNHVVRYFDAWIEDDLLYIQLENIEGCSLAGFVNKYAPHTVPEETLCKLLCHIAQALYDMHSKKMVHMDVKLQNVLVGPGEVYKLGDLGTVAHLDGSMEITEGDNRYLSRELLEGNRSNLRAGDIFALGATIYELALGTTLASGGEEWQKIRDGDLVMFRQYSNSLQHLIASMMHPDALQRPLAEDILQHEVVLPFR